MMRMWLVFFCVLAVLSRSAFAITCGTDNTNVYQIHYSCGDGTVATSLPAATEVSYNQSVTPTFMKSQCTAPDGYIWAGQEIVVDGSVSTILLANSATAMTYLYTRDITIQPRYVVSDAFINIPELGGPTYSSNKSARTWTFDDWMGRMSGQAICADVDNGTSNTISGYMPPKDVQAEINAVHESAADSSAHNGMKCFCRLTSNGTSNWALGAVYSSNSACAGDCAAHCAWKLQQTSGTSEGTWLRRALTAHLRVAD